MKDVWIIWLVQGLIVVLLIVVWFWFKRWINQQDEERQGWVREGGLITREKYFNFCKDQQSRCPACGAYRILMEWRNGMLDKGGVMLKGEYLALSKEMTKEMTENFCERIDELFEHHRQWVGQELKLLRMEVTKAREK